MALSINTKNSLFLIGEKVIALGFAFVNSVLLARIAGPEIFGQYNYLLSFVGLFAPLCIMGLNNIATKYFVKYPNNSHYYLLSALSVRAIGAVIATFMGIITAHYYTTNTEQLSPLYTLFILQSFTVLFLFEYYFIATNKILVSLQLRLCILVSTGTAKLLVIVNGASLQLLVTVHGLEYALIGLGYVCLYYYQGHHKNQKRSINIHSIAALFHKGKWLLLSGAAAVLYLKIDQIMLAHFHDTTEVGYYAAAVKLSEFWYVFPILIANAFNPKLILLNKKNKSQYQNLTTTLLSFMVTAALIISLLTYLCSEFIVTSIYGLTFRQSADILEVHIFSTLFIFQLAILSKWLIIAKHYKFSLYSHGLGALVNIVLNLLLIPEFGGLGAAWATLLSYFVASYVSLILFKSTRPFMLLMIKAVLKCPSNLVYTVRSYVFNTHNSPKDS